MDKVADVADKIVENNTECAKTGHLYGAPTYSWNEEHSVCIATFKCKRSECKSNYENNTITKNMSVKGPVYTYGTCTEDGTETYTATCKFTDTDKGVVEGYDPDYDFTTQDVKVWQRKTGHKFNIKISNNDATCEKDGTYKLVCANCGEVDDKNGEFYTDEGTAKGHTPGSIVIENEDPATCTQGGSYDAVRRCVRCNIVMEGEEGTGHFTTDPNGHTEAAAVKENSVPATCEQDGSYDNVVYCSVCGEELSRESVTVPAKGHKRTVVIENQTFSTCTENGTYDKVTKCSVCGYEYSRETVTLDTTEHDTERVVTKEATCTEGGTTESVCKICGTHIGDISLTDPLDHDYEETEVDPTCTEEGYTLYTCTRCGDSYKDNFVSSNGHTPDSGTVTKEPTCTEKGTKTYVCTVCGETLLNDDIEETGHKNWDIKPIAATCETIGYTKYHCNDCGYEYIIENSQPTGHSIKVDVTTTKEATCTKEGNNDKVYSCTKCGEVLKTEHIAIPKAKHRYNKKNTKATCTEQGYSTFTCSVCGDEYRGEITPCKGHTEVDVSAVPATCIETGLTAGKKCSVCGVILEKQEDTPTVDHTWNKGVITKQPTVDETGVKTYTCTYCGDTKTEKIPKLTVEEATPSDDEAKDANVNKKIKKPEGITTVSHLKKKELEIFFNKVNGAQNYRVMYRKQGAKKWNYAWTDGKTKYTLKNLKANGLYEFMFAAYEKNSKSEWERGNYSKTSYRYYYKAKINKVKPGKKSAEVKWTKDKAGTGYELFYSTDKDMKKRKKTTIKDKKTTSYTIKGLKKGKKYYIRVRSLKKKAGKTYVGEFSSQKTVKVK